MDQDQLIEPLRQLADHCATQMAIGFAMNPSHRVVTIRKLPTAFAPMQAEPLSRTITLSIETLARAAYALGREHEKAEGDLINEAHIDALDKQSDSRTLAIVAGLMAQLDLSTLKLDLSSVARVFNYRMLTSSMTEPGFVEYHLTQRPKEY